MAARKEDTTMVRKAGTVGRIVKWVVLAIIAAVIVIVLFFVGTYFTRFQTIATMEKLSSYEDNCDLYRMDIKYNYDLDRIIDYGITDDQSMINALVKEALPYIPYSFELPDFGCSAFTLECTDGDHLMGRNYDFKYDTSAMLVYCTPKDGYKSVAFSALSNIYANQPQASMTKKLSTLLCPFICLDGVNEKGVSIAVLTLDSEPARQDTGKPKISTSLAIRLVLDRAASTEEAVKLLSEYDMYASNGRDYHFYITDASGDGRVIEYDCESETREMKATPMNAITNFFALYEDKVLPNQHNGIYGHGRERYDAMLKVFDEQKDDPTVETAWDALKAASQKPNPEEVTSNTQWSIVFNNTDLTADFTLRRHWGDIYHYDLNNDTVEKVS